MNSSAEATPRKLRTLSGGGPRDQYDTGHRSNSPRDDRSSRSGAGRGMRGLRYQACGIRPAVREDPNASGQMRQIMNSKTKAPGSNRLQIRSQNSKQIRMTQIGKTLERIFLPIWGFGFSGFEIDFSEVCFGFRDSDFGFSSWKKPNWERKELAYDPIE
jgi:hypothetical protein